MNEQEMQNKPRELFEKKWMKSVLIGMVILVVVLVVLKVFLQTTSVSPMYQENSSLALKNFSNGSSTGVIMSDVAPAPVGLASKSMAQDAVLGSTLAMTPNSTVDSADKKVIKNGDLNLKVNNIDNASGDISGIAAANGGSVYSSNIYNQNNFKSGNIVIRVPVANFEKTFTEVKKVAALVIRESTTGQDVTEEYVDLQAQLKNRQAEEAQFQTILQQAQKIQDVLDVTQQLYQVRGEIEQLQGRIKFLDSQTDMSSISVSLSEDQNITVTDSWRPWQVAKDAVNSLIKKVQEFITFAIILVITVVPTVILYLILIYIIFIIARKVYRKIRGNK